MAAPPDLVSDPKVVGARCFVRAVRRTSNLVTRVYNGYFKSVGIEATQFWILCAIAASNANSATELAEVLGVEKSTLKRGLDRMIESGLIVAQRGDGRRVLVEATPALREWTVEVDLLMVLAALGAAIGVGPSLALASYNVFEDVPDCGLCTYSDSRWAAMLDAARPSPLEHEIFDVREAIGSRVDALDDRRFAAALRLQRAAGEDEQEGEEWFWHS